MNGAYSSHANMFASPLCVHMLLLFFFICSAMLIRGKVIGGSANGSDWGLPSMFSAFFVALNFGVNQICSILCIHKDCFYVMLS